MTEGLRDRQRRETHLLIRRAAVDLALQHGVSGFTVQDLSRSAGISQRTFFNHFRSKEEALVPELPAFSPKAEQAFVERAEPDLLTALETLLVSHLQTGVAPSVDDGPALMMRLIEANPELLPRMLAVFEDFEQRVCDLIARRTGRDPGDLFCRVVALTVIGTVRAALDTWHRSEPSPPGTPPDPAMLRAAFTVLREVTVTPGA